VINNNGLTACVQYILYYVRFGLFVKMRELVWIAEELWYRFVKVYFVSSSLVAICYGYIC